MTRSRHRLLTGPALVLAFVFAGCEPAIDSHEVQQPATAGPVRVISGFCAGNGQPGTVDTTSCRSTSGYDTAGTLLAAYEVPLGTEPVSSKFEMPGWPTRDLVRDAAFEAWLEANDPVAAGREWIAFQSPWLGMYTADETQRRTATLVTVFDPPAGGTSFPHRTVLRNRDVLEANIAQPVNCSPVNSCPPLERLASVALAGTWTLRDASIAAGAPIVAARGTSADVPFTVRYTGNQPSEAFRTWSSTSLPAAPTRASSPEIAFGGAGTVPASVNVNVPAGAPLGPHDVTLRIDLPGGQTREATGRIEVVPAPVVQQPVKQQQQQQDEQPPKTIALADIRSALTKLKLTSARRATLRGKGVRFSQQFLAAGRATWTVKAATGKKALLGRATRTVAGAGMQSVVVKLSGSGRRALGRRGLKRLTLTTSFVDAGGRKASARNTIRVK